MRAPKTGMRRGNMFTGKTGSHQNITFLKRHGDDLLATVPSFSAMFDDYHEHDDRKIDFFITMHMRSGHVNRKVWYFNDCHNLD